MYKFVLASLAVLACFTSIPSHADIYYVNRNIGNDAWSGRQATVTNGNGPWQSLKRLADATLKPGDEVRLACGQTWPETLRLAASGTSVSPITVRAWPLTCSLPPTIDGALSVPSFLWTYEAGGRWRAPLDLTVVRNGGAESGSFGWNLWAPNQDARLSSTSVGCRAGAAPCLTAVSGLGAAGQVSILSSFGFPLESVRTYVLTFSVKAASGVPVRVMVRRAAAPWDAVPGTAQQIMGTGAWSDYSVEFRSASAMANARVDIEIPAGGVTVGIDSVVVRPQIEGVREVFADGAALLPAHHPNHGVDPANPRSLYLPLARDADARTRVLGTVTKTGSSFLPLGSELILPSGTTLVGANVRVRSRPWTLEERRITSVSSGNAMLDGDTDFPLKQGFGYFLTGARWMLDAPGEWFADTAANQLVLQMPDNSFPQGRVSVVHLTRGIDLSRAMHIVVEGLRVTRTFIGVDLARSTSVHLRNCIIENTVDEGVDISGATATVVQATRFWRTGSDAIGVTLSGMPAWQATISRNSIRESGVRYGPDGVTSLPVASYGAIRSGVDGTVTENTIVGAGYSGIVPSSGGSIVNNVIERTCMILDDCGGIYAFGQGLNLTISGNIIRDLEGTNDGKPASEYNLAHAVGIYLDEHSSQATVTSNTVVNAQYGIQLHNAFNNIVRANTLYGNRTYQLWLQEGRKDVRATGDIFGNAITDNVLVPTGFAFGLSLDSAFASTSSFATFDRNVYSTLASPTIAREKWTGTELSHTFATWRAAKNTDGSSRLLDVNGFAVAPTGYTSFEVAGPNMVSNANFAAGLEGWARWNEIAPKAAINQDGCGTVPCVKLVPGASSSLLSSPHLSTVAGQTYRFTVDIRGSVDNQKIVLAPRRGGGGDNGYEVVADQRFNFFVSTGWRRFVVVFTANKTISAGDPATKDVGVRLDLQQVQTGQPIWVRNMELVPLRPVGTTLRTAILSNPTATTIAVPCPDALTFPVACGQYVRFQNASAVQWPLSVAPYASQLVYTRDSTLVDTDSDGIADVQDLCPGTAALAQTNASGCALGQ